jgi:uncharacterized phage protein (TIGR01671 family)
MSRPIKFRAWDVSHRRWNCASIGLTSDGELVEIVSMGDNTGTELLLMQYTGFEDKNGVEIYEGDVVTYRYIDEGRSVVECSQYSPSFRPWSQLRESVWPTIEVIGNIYENPELVE